MNRDEPALVTGTWLTPSWEHATVGDAMSAPVIDCPPDTPLTAVARTMATRHVHAVVVTDDEANPIAWRVVSDHAIAAGGAEADQRTASDVAERPGEAAEADWPLDRAATLMAQHGVTHLVVVDPHGRPAGMLSTLDLAGIIAWGRS